MVRASAFALALAAVLGGCSSYDAGTGLEIVLTTSSFATPLTEAHWVSCSDAGCRFQAEGRNVGRDCARSIRGSVRFETADGPILDGQGNQLILDWQLSPSPGASVQPNTNFTYQTQARVPADIMSTATHYSSLVLLEGALGC